MTRLALLFALVLPFVLAGCTSSSSSMAATNIASSSTDAVSITGALQNSNSAITDGTLYAVAATASPREGSVTQSSNVGSGESTLDKVETTALYNSDGRLVFTITNKPDIDSGDRWSDSHDWR